MKKVKKKENLWKALKNNLYLFKLSFEACPSRVIGEFFYIGFRYGSKLFYSIIFLGFIFKFIEEGTDFKTILLFLIIVGLFLGICGLYRSAYERTLSPIGNQKLYEKLHIRMYEKATDVELECYENPEFYNQYTKAASQIKGRAFLVVHVIPELICSIICICYAVTRIVIIDKYAVLLGIIPLITTYFLGKKSNQVKYDLYQENITREREKEYIKRTIYQKEYAKEIRLTHVFDLMMMHFNEATDAVISNTKRYGLKIGFLNFMQGSTNELLTGMGAVVYAALRLLYFKSIKISDYMVLISAIDYLAWCLTNAAKLLSKVQDTSLYIQNVKDFLEYKPKISESQEGIIPDDRDMNLSLKDVSFTYFGQTQPVLKHIDMQIRKGEKIALVGHNGAGKSTLVKLLMRLYDVTEGEIQLNGMNITEYNVKAYRKLFGTVFQDYKVLSLSVAENVLMDSVTEEDRPRVEQALRDSGVYHKVMTLPKGMDTTLTREFDNEGVELSGGELQKIAIARVFAKDGNIAILDEPSSALDPIAEYKMYESMLRACKDKSVIFISHRLSSAVLADKIYLLENGEVIESGSHAQLMEKNGKYAQMFLFQAENYK